VGAVETRGALTATGIILTTGTTTTVFVSPAVAGKMARALPVVGAEHTRNTGFCPAGAARDDRPAPSF